MKRLPFLMTLLSLLIFSNHTIAQGAFHQNESWEIFIKDDSNRVRKHIMSRRANEFMVTYRYPNAPGAAAGMQRTKAFLLSKGYKLIKTCDCSNKLELWEYPVGAAPDGQDVKGTSGASGGDMSWNYIVYNGQKDSLVEALRLAIPRITLTDIYPQVENPSAQVTLAIVDSGVDPQNGLIANNRFTTNYQYRSSHLFNNVDGALFCGSQYKEGKVGMNILHATDSEQWAEPKDDDGHGTFIGGIVAGIARPSGIHVTDSKGINIKQLHARIIRQRDKSGDLFSALCGIHYAINKGAKVINASWRVKSNYNNEDSIKRAFYPTLDDVRENNILLVAAAGNDTLNLDKEGKAWPAAFAKIGNKAIPKSDDFSGNVLSVGALGLNQKKAYFTNFGSYVNIYAPGMKINSTGLSNEAKEGQGTSYAAPFVARWAAILMGLCPNISPAAVKNHIIKYSGAINDIRFLDTQSCFKYINALCKKKVKNQ